MRDDNEWRQRIADAYGRHAPSIDRAGRMVVRTSNGSVVHEPTDDPSLEAEKTALGRLLVRDQSLSTRLPEDDRDLRRMSCQSFFRRLLRHHAVDVDALNDLRWSGVRPRPLIHDRGDMPAKYRNVIGSHDAGLPDAASMKDMPSFVIEAWVPYAITVILSPTVVMRGGSPANGGRATMSLKGDMLPGTMASAATGRPLHEVVRHPALKGSGHMIASVRTGRSATTLNLTTAPDRMGTMR